MVPTWAHWASLGFSAQVFVTMDRDTYNHCVQHNLICANGTASILHKYSFASLALQLGVDVFYSDMDGIPVRHDFFNVTWSAKTADGTWPPDLVVTTHAFDCLNAGVWFARASPETAGFFIRLTNFLYEQWFETDQRVFDYFAIGNISLSHDKSDFPQLRVATLDPDAFAGPTGIEKIEESVYFHAYGVRGNEKQELMLTLLGMENFTEDVIGSMTKDQLAEWMSRVNEGKRWSAFQALEPYRKERTETGCW